MVVKLKGVGYLRISDNKQTDNHSEEIQKRMIRERARQEGIEIIKWRFDEAESAYRKRAAKRENLRELINDANEADAIIFYDESRLTRRISDFYEEIYCPIKERYPHVKFISTQSPGEWDPNDPIVQAKFVFAAEESHIKSIRAIDAQSSLLENKVRPGARSPIGYDLIGGVLIANDEAPIVVTIFDLASWGNSNDKIAEFLNANHVTTKYISKWHSSTIDYILHNYAYADELRWNVKHSNSFMNASDTGDFGLFDSVHEAIISPVMFAIVNQVKDYKKKYGKLDTPFFLRNLLHCGNCNSILVAKDNSPKTKSKQYQVYRCPTCKETIRADEVHDEVLADLAKKWTSNLNEMINESKKILSKWLKTLQALKKSVDQTEDRILLNERLLNQQDNSEDLSNTINRIKQSLEVIRKEKLKLIQAIEKVNLLNDDKALYEVYSHFKHADITSLFNTELRTLCLTFIDRIKLTPKEVNGFSLSIIYRLNPFVELEYSTGQITEQLLNQLPGKPNEIKK
ncbi:recombinase family protein [Paenibacillus alkaliterrae]|uniref:recombinase family protein n=1 Tax=Paenibacillus alkaliterrae TaxID=320909 RepID=UPI001F48520E|nr:recombinase family protein [Paenibacillus alkaliterrae]MCF2941039.1 recombinase family protein [Paenibacillus alkaliterrae]